MKKQRPHILLLGIVLVIALTWTVLSISLQQHQSLDQRVQAVAVQVRCPICQGESIADSSTTIAEQMRTVAREQLQSGRSEQEVLQYFRDHYGNQIVMTPPWNGFALLAWLVPFVLVLIGLVLVVRILREWLAQSMAISTDRATPVADDEAALAQLDEAELAVFRSQLELELAADDTLFKTYGTEAR
ncbi:MAG TPA: cytochrome c-type biogenesis protein CcmH [Ktedonobacteraceae bacterium]|jgi:cytochrome c-type biogenesis protein CcmH